MTDGESNERKRIDWDIRIVNTNEKNDSLLVDNGTAPLCWTIRNILTDVIGVKSLVE